MHADLLPESDRELIGYAAWELAGTGAWVARRLDGGFQARVYLVECNGGDKMLVARAGDDVPALYREFLIERDVVPGIMGSVIRMLGFFAGVSSGLSVREYVAGETLLQASDVDYGAVMDLLATLHAVDPRTVPASWAGIYWDYSGDRLARGFENMVSMLAALEGGPLRPEWFSHTLVDCCERLSSRAQEVIAVIGSADKSLVHGDAVPVNLLKVAQTGGYQLLDWQQFGLYVPHVDVISALYHHEPDERQPLVERYLATFRQLTGRRLDPHRFATVMDFADLQRSADVASFWLGNVLAGRTAYERVAGFVGRRVQALERIARQYGL